MAWIGLTTLPGFELTPALLAQHRNGVTMCLSPAAVGRSFEMMSGRPSARRWGRWSRNGAGVFTAMEPMGSRRDDDEEDDDNPDSERDAAPMVAVVQLRGLLSSEVESWACGFSDGYAGTGGIVDRARAAGLHPRAGGGLVLDIMSPGGDARGVGEAAAALAELREEMADMGRPLLVYASLAASAACWLGAAAAGPGGFFVSQSSDVGCIGTWARHVDASGAAAKEGLQFTLIEDPEGKTAGNPYSALSDEARERMQAEVSETTARFVAAVASYRGGAITTAGARALRGATRRGEAAIAAGLADFTSGGLADVVAVAFARSSAARPVQTLSLSVPASPAPDPSSPGSAMPLPSALVRAAGLDPAKTPTDAVVLAALEERLGFAQAALELTGATAPKTALGVIGAWKASHGAAEGERADRERERVVAEGKERVELVAKLVESGWELPATAWENPELAADPAQRKVAPTFATMPLEALRARVATLVKQPKAFAGAPKEAREAATFTPPEIERRAAAAGLPADAYAEAAAQVRAAMSRAPQPVA